jgi:hypothetical protein
MLNHRKGSLSRRGFLKVISSMLLILLTVTLAPHPVLAGNVGKIYKIYLPHVYNINTGLPVAFYEPWSPTQNIGDNWDPIGAPNYSIIEPGIMQMVNQSAGIVSKYKFDRTKQIIVLGKVRAREYETSTTDTYWGGITIYANDGTDKLYGELVVERNISWYRSPIPRVISLTNENRVRNLVDDGQSWTWHDFRIIYNPNDPANRYQYFVDGKLSDTASQVTPLNVDPVVFLLAVSSGVNDDSLAQVEFTPITVYGYLK